MASKDQIRKAAMAAFRSVEVSVGTEKVRLRELNRAERQALDKSNYEMKPDGSGLLEDEKGFLVPLEPFDIQAHMDRWIVATIEPSFTAEEIADWPVSLKRGLWEQAKRINNIEPAEAIAKNS